MTYHCNANFIIQLNIKSILIFFQFNHCCQDIETKTNVPMYTRVYHNYYINNWDVFTITTILIIIIIENNCHQILGQTNDNGCKTNSIAYQVYVRYRHVFVIVVTLTWWVVTDNIRFFSHLTPTMSQQSLISNFYDDIFLDKIFRQVVQLHSRVPGTRENNIIRT